MRIICLSSCLGICAFAQAVGTPPTPPVSAPAAPAAPAAQTASVAVPPAGEIRRVLDYYFNGKNSPPALVEFIPCLNVDTQQGSATLSQCLEVAKGSVPTNTRLHLWTMWYLPMGSKYEDVFLQVFWGEQLRSTDDYRLETAGRFRTWKTVSLNRKGIWTFKILSGTQELGSHKLLVE